jgi:hypothetical protein
VRLGTRVLGALSTLALAGTIVGVSAAHADQVAGCTGSTALASITPAITDVPAQNTTAVKLAKVVTGPNAGSSLAGTCTGPSSVVPGGTLHIHALAAKTSGVTSCQEQDYNATDGVYPQNGKLTVTFTETGADTKPYQIASYIRFGSGDSLDTTDIIGIVTKGVAVGSSVGGSLWEDPATKLTNAGKARTVTDAQLTAGSPNITSTKAKFTATDVNAAISGNGIPAGTVISSVTDASHAVMSNAATASGSPVSVTITDDPGYLNTGYHLATFAEVLPCVDGTDGNFSSVNAMLGDGPSPLTNTPTLGLQFTL